MDNANVLRWANAAVPCLMTTWQQSESALYRWLLKQSGDAQLSGDLLQETFLKALQQQQKFCDIDNQRAWLYRVAHNLLVDELRRSGRVVNDEASQCQVPVEPPEPAAVDNLAQCLPKALQKLSAAEREVIDQCDLRGLPQRQFARVHGLTDSATKSRIQRARKKLKIILQRQCHIHFDDQQRVCCFFRDDASDELRGE